MTVRAFRAMGTDCAITVFGPQATALAELGEQRIALLEQSWSRFRPGSELNRLNARAGEGPVEVSDDLRTLVEAMQAGWRWTDGLFDPTVLWSMRALGYDADFATVIARDAVASVQASPAPGMAGVVIDGSTVAVPAGVGLDPGAIGKGLAADILVEELLMAGAVGVLVDLGGDVVLGGTPDLDEAWVVDVLDERAGGERVLTTLSWDAPVDRVAVATSTSLRRRWADGRHHVVDPRTGTVADLTVVQSTVVATDGWQAEVAATAAMLLGREAGSAWLDEQGLTGWLLASQTSAGVMTHG